MINQGTLVQAGSTPSPESAPELPLPPLREDLKLLEVSEGLLNELISGG